MAANLPTPVDQQNLKTELIEEMKTGLSIIIIKIKTASDGRRGGIIVEVSSGFEPL